MQLKLIQKPVGMLKIIILNDEIGLFPEPEPLRTIESTIAERLENESFNWMKPIERNLYKVPDEQKHLSEEQLKELYSNGGVMNVYPFREDSEVDIPPPVNSFKQAFGNNRKNLDSLMKMFILTYSGNYGRN